MIKKILYKIRKLNYNYEKPNVNIMIKEGNIAKSQTHKVNSSFIINAEKI